MGDHGVMSISVDVTAKFIQTYWEGHLAPCVSNAAVLWPNCRAIMFSRNLPFKMRICKEVCLPIRSGLPRELCSNIWLCWQWVPALSGIGCSSFWVSFCQRPFAHLIWVRPSLITLLTFRGHLVFWNVSHFLWPPLCHSQLFNPSAFIESKSIGYLYFGSQVNNQVYILLRSPLYLLQMIKLAFNS